MNPTFLQTLLENQPDYDADIILYPEGWWPGVGKYKQLPLPEGLITSHSASSVQSYLRIDFRLKSEVMPEANDPRGGMLKVYGSTPIPLWHRILQRINNAGWYPCYAIVGGYDGKYPVLKDTTNKQDVADSGLKQDIDNSIIYGHGDFTIYLEAKYARIVTVDYPVYHCSPRRRRRGNTDIDDVRNKIAKIGLVPSAKSKKAGHNHRIYFTDTLSDCEDMAPEIASHYGSSECDIYEVDAHGVTFYKDPADQNQHSLYTYTNIPPAWLKLVKTVTV